MEIQWKYSVNTVENKTKITLQMLQIQCKISKGKTTKTLPKLSLLLLLKTEIERRKKQSLGGRQYIRQYILMSEHTHVHIKV